MIHKPPWSGTMYNGHHTAHHLATHSHQPTFCSAKLPYTPSLLVSYEWCSPCLNLLLWSLYWPTSPSGLHLCITSSRTFPGPCCPHLHCRMDFYQVCPWHLPRQSPCILYWSCLPTRVSDLNSKVNLIRKTCMYFFFKQMKYSWQWT